MAKTNCKQRRFDLNFVPSDIHVPRGVIPSQPRTAEGKARGVVGVGGFQIRSTFQSASMKSIANEKTDEK